MHDLWLFDSDLWCNDRSTQDFSLIWTPVLRFFIRSCRTFGDEHRCLFFHWRERERWEDCRFSFFILSLWEWLIFSVVEKWWDQEEELQASCVCIPNTVHRCVFGRFFRQWWPILFPELFLKLWDINFFQVRPVHQEGRGLSYRCLHFGSSGRNFWCGWRCPSDGWVFRKGRR